MSTQPTPTPGAKAPAPTPPAPEPVKKSLATVSAITLSVIGTGPVPEMKDTPEIIGGKRTGRTLTEPTGRMIPGQKHVSLSAHEIEGVLDALDDHDHEHAGATSLLLRKIADAAAFLLEHFDDAHALRLGINPVEAVPEVKNGRDTGLILVGDKAVLPKDVGRAVAQLESDLHDDAVEAALPTK